MRRSQGMEDGGSDKKISEASGSVQFVNYRIILVGFSLISLLFEFDPDNQ